MRNKPSGADDERATTTADQDDRDQAAILREVLFIYPEVLTLDELARQMTFGSYAFARGDRIERAVRDLTGAASSSRSARSSCRRGPLSSSTGWWNSDGR